MKKIINIVFGLLLIILIIVSLSFFGYYFYFWMKNNNTLSVPIITAIIGFIGVIWTQWQSKTREITESHRKSKIETYSLFFDIIETFYSAQRQSREIDVTNDLELQSKFEKLNRGFILWASDEVIQAWIAFKTNTSDNPLGKIDNVYRAIRKDLGHKDIKLKKLDLVKINLSNPEEL